ncbi:ImmA/IrrE family metallo-endopeptidase [Facklamia sp. P13064]|uniref:ImmA/IrrE family metallo-endopeptidase n=1 Tax=Facklamia sp. P13064 TaxID=3421953 RepID=UPI003D17A36F
MNQTIIDKVVDLVNYHKTSNPFEIADNYMIDVRYAPTDDDFKGIYLPIYNKQLIILNKKLEHTQERYFVMSHELWHAINDYDVVSYYHIGINAKGKMERVANQFATALCLFDKEIDWNKSSFCILKENYIPYEMEEYL